MGKGTFKLTKKTAQELLKQELNLNNSLTTEENIPGFNIYYLYLGCLKVIIENDWLKRNGRICITISYSGISMVKYFYPDTLDEDFLAGDKYYDSIRDEIISEYKESLNRVSLLYV